MGFKATDHQNAIVKMVRGKRIILQIDLSTLMNKKDISYSVEKLVKEGKINRQKIKNRGKVGNLTDVWVLFMPDVKRLDLLEFEKQMINKEFVSPLIENHCYKSAEQPVEQRIKDSSKVVDIQKYVKIQDTDLMIKEFQGKRVVTFKEVDAVHERSTGTARKRFNDNKDRFIENVDYFIAKPNDSLMSEKRTLEITIPNRGLTLLTETGYMMLVKSFTDDLSWDVQRQLVNSYFKVKEIKKSFNNNLSVTKQNTDMTDTYDILRVFATGITDLNDRVESLEGTIESLKTAINAS